MLSLFCLLCLLAAQQHVRVRVALEPIVGDVQTFHPQRALRQQFVGRLAVVGVERFDFNKRAERFDDVDVKLDIVDEEDLAMLVDSAAFARVNARPFAAERATYLINTPFDTLKTAAIDAAVSGVSTLIVT